jgi:hypothetical protein
MTPQEIFDYKTVWLQKGGYPVKIHSDLDIEGKYWCRQNVERHKWSFTSYTDIYEHTFIFEEEETAKKFEDWLYDRTIGRYT